jgi:LysM repeat protein
VEKVAEKAGKAAPAMACAGVIAAVPATHDLTSAKHVTVAAQVLPAHLDAATSPAHEGWISASNTASTASAATAGTARSQAARTYSVRTGDTLSSISQRYYNNGADWPWLYHQNSSGVQDPNLIYSGQQVKVPANPPSNASSMSWYQPKHAASTTADTSQVGSASSGGSSGSSSGGGSGGGAASATGLGGSLGCSGLEQLWTAAGGNPGSAGIAASIAMAESGGNQYATGGVGEEGYWQINPVNGSLATYDPLGNAQAAVTLSGNGSNWSPWTTYTSGAYQGQC